MAIVGGAIVPVLQGAAGRSHRHPACLRAAARVLLLHRLLRFRRLAHRRRFEGAWRCRRTQVHRAWRGTEMKPIVCFGEALIDFQPVPHDDPAQPRDIPAARRRRAGQRRRRRGAPRRRRRLRRHARHRHVRRLPARQPARAPASAPTMCSAPALAPTALAFVSLDAHGERSFSFYRPPAADLLFRECKLSPTACSTTRARLPRLFEFADRGRHRRRPRWPACAARARPASWSVST